MDYPKRIIKKGEADQTIVKAVQKQLGARGITNVAVDGVFGDETVGGVKLFQTLYRDAHGKPLEVDGIVGALTWESLFGIVMTPNAATTTPLFTAALSVAQSQVGIMENPPSSNRGTEVDAYNRGVGNGLGSYWCAAFVYYCFNQAASNIGIANPLYKTGGCLEHWNHSKAKKIKAADARNNPELLKPGHIFIKDYGNGHGHTGIIKRIEGGRLITIEGNSNNDGSSNGIGVFELSIRTVWSADLKGYLDYGAF